MFRTRRPIAWTYHRATSRWPFNMHRVNENTREVPPFKEDLEAATVPLGTPRLPAADLASVLRGRSSCRRFAAEPIALGDLGCILHAGYGVLGTVDLAGEFCERPVPSGGGLYPIELYVVVQRVDGLGGGVYHYAPLGHLLEVVRPDPLPSQLTSEMCLGQPYLVPASAILVITAVVERSLWKYEDRAHRYILLEAGHVAQNLNLAAEALGLASLNLGVFFDEDLMALLKLDPDHEVALCGVALGRAGDDRRERRFPEDPDAALQRL